MKFETYRCDTCPVEAIVTDGGGAPTYWREDRLAAPGFKDAHGNDLEIDIHRCPKCIAVQTRAPAVAAALEQFAAKIAALKDCTCSVTVDDVSWRVHEYYCPLNPNYEPPEGSAELDSAP